MSCPTCGCFRILLDTPYQPIFPQNVRLSCEIGGECPNICKNRQHFGHDVENRSGEVKHKLNIHPTRWIVYSASCSGNSEGYFGGWLRLFRAISGGYVGGVWEESGRCSGNVLGTGSFTMWVLQACEQGLKHHCTASIRSKLEAGGYPVVRKALQSPISSILTPLFFCRIYSFFLPRASQKPPKIQKNTKNNSPHFPQTFRKTPKTLPNLPKSTKQTTKKL